MRPNNGFLVFKGLNITLHWKFTSLVMELTSIALLERHGAGLGFLPHDLSFFFKSGSTRFRAPESRLKALASLFSDRLHS